MRTFATCLLFLFIGFPLFGQPTCVLYDHLWAVPATYCPDASASAPIEPWNPPPFGMVPEGSPYLWELRDQIGDRHLYPRGWDPQDIVVYGRSPWKGYPLAELADSINRAVPAWPGGPEFDTFLSVLHLEERRPGQGLYLSSADEFFKVLAGFPSDPAGSGTHTMFSCEAQLQARATGPNLIWKLGTGGVWVSAPLKPFVMAFSYRDDGAGAREYSVWRNGERLPTGSREIWPAEEISTIGKCGFRWYGPFHEWHGRGILGGGLGYAGLTDEQLVGEMRAWACAEGSFGAGGLQQADGSPWPETCP